MKISGKSLRSIDKLVSLAAGLKEVILGVNLSNIDKETLHKIGFTEKILEGDSILPTPVGKTTTFNARGKEIKRPDLPKETYHVTYNSTTYDWHKQPHYGTKTRTALRIAREYIPAPSIFLTLANINGQLYIISPVIFIDDKNKEYNLHVINVLLECFGEFELLDNSQKPLHTTKFRKIQWDILPRGVYPWSKVAEMILSGTANLDKDEAEIIKYRLSIMNSYQPDFIGVGHGGFNGYFVFGFENKNTYILESIYLDNATYIFHEQWEPLSKLTKNEIINSDIEHIRIIHDKKWKQAVGIAITRSKRGQA
ncbi:hypothetical protein [Rahnella inusitata]|uniref:Uncharacterized protein n=1 Tax=Rahnella inusitata TaxID=58169 RepID=A0ABX9P6J6_9GAMM|nr:hypothetical protein [Rahnella inusitata]RJT16259.1 hypothetical protein D5396_03890 [Rahnella inusitata]